jgi:hypothetical protein
MREFVKTVSDGIFRRTLIEGIAITVPILSVSANSSVDAPSFVRERRLRVQIPAVTATQDQYNHTVANIFHPLPCRKEMIFGNAMAVRVKQENKIAPFPSCQKT